MGRTRLIFSTLGKYPISGYDKKITFRVRSQEKKSPLACLALREVSKNKPAVLFFVPHSLYTNPGSLTLEVQKEDGIEYIPAPSIGYYGNYRFIAKHSDMVFFYFINFLQRTLELREDLGEVYCDINIGLNVFVDAMKEAFRYLYVFYGLMYYQENGKLSFRTLYSEPLIGRNMEQETATIYSTPLNIKIWFSMPISKSDYENGFPNLKEFLFTREEIEVLERGYLTYLAIKNNAPLVVLTLGYDKPRKILSSINQVVQRINKKLFNPLKYQRIGNHIQYPFSGEKGKAVINALLSLALYYDIAKTLDSLSVEKVNYIELDELASKFRKVYEAYSLNQNLLILEHDIRSWKKRKGIPSTFVPGTEIEKNKKGRDKKRNFKAHSGFLNEAIEVKKIDGKIFMRYTFGFRDKDVLIEYLWE